MKKRRVKRRQNKRLQFPRRYLTLTTPLLLKWLLFFAVIFLLIIVYKSQLFTIKTINCITTSDQAFCPNTVLAELERLKGQVILTLNLNQIKSKLLSADPKINSVAIDVNLPNTLTTTISYQPAAFAIQIATDSAGFVVDQSGSIISLEETIGSNLVKIITSQAQHLSVGDTITNSVINYAFSLSRALKQNYIDFDQIIIGQFNTITVILNSNQQVLFSIQNNIERSVTSLQLILSKATISSTPHQIDLRFDKPVLKY